MAVKVVLLRLLALMAGPANSVRSGRRRYCAASAADVPEHAALGAIDGPYPRRGRRARSARRGLEANHGLQAETEPRFRCRAATGRRYPARCSSEPSSRNEKKFTFEPSSLASRNVYPNRPPSRKRGRESASRSDSPRPATARTRAWPFLSHPTTRSRTMAPVKSMRPSLTAVTGGAACTTAVVGGVGESGGSGSCTTTVGPGRRLGRAYVGVTRRRIVRRRRAVVGGGGVLLAAARPRRAASAAPRSSARPRRGCAPSASSAGSPCRRRSPWRRPASAGTPGRCCRGTPDRASGRNPAARPRSPCRTARGRSSFDPCWKS